MKNGQLTVEQTFRHDMHLSERLTDSIDIVLRSASVTLEEVSAFAVGIGPGSFTGTRIGVMTAKTLAAVCKKPLFGINGLETLSHSFRGLNGFAIVPILPCRTDVVFTALYFTTDYLPLEITSPAALSLEQLVERITASGRKQVLLCGAAVPRYCDRLVAMLDALDIRGSTGDERSPQASLIALLADKRFAAADPGEDPLELVPLYISPPPITLSKIPIPTGSEVSTAS